ncbi:putative calcium-binding protein CML10 [Camellia lanceoleosa]|uniref:Calcium-binding protein CML10 n=1 Tax=Camellia lanceoleosa TaxID=1840588 RepID=A0ACC0HSC9_9ERIC|nr:putative calcium-binding protein CML10 [Camellia lanceoleosa]
MLIYEDKAFWGQYEVTAFNQPLNEEQLNGIFKKRDKNGDGRLSRKELKKAFEELGAWIPDWRALRGLCNADANGTRFISEEEMNSLLLYAL